MVDYCSSGIVCSQLAAGECCAGVTIFVDAAKGLPKRLSKDVFVRYYKGQAGSKWLMTDACCVVD